MREIPLTQGQVAIVDDDDYEALSKHKWCAKRHRSTFYAERAVRLPDGRRTSAYMHRVILGVGPGVQVDHENRHGFDNRNENLRVATNRQNGQNQGKRAGTSSRHKGVSWDNLTRKWRAQINSGPIGPNGRASAVHLGLYDDEEAAAHAYDTAARAAFGEFARVNFP